RTTLLQPVVKAPVHLHQLPKVPPSLPALTIRFSLASSAPQPFRQHPSPQGLRVDPQPILARQMFGRQRRPKSLSLARSVLLPRHLAHPQNLLSGSARPHPLSALSQLGGTAALHDARVGNRPVRQAHLTAADLSGDVCPNAARQTRQPSTPPRSASNPALNPPIPHLRPAPETSDRLPISHSPGHRHLPATHRQLLATPPWE